MKKKLLTLLIVILLLSGMSLMLYPAVSDYLNRVSRAEDISEYVASVDKMDEADYRHILDEAVEYNMRLASSPAHWVLNQEELDEYESRLNIAGSRIIAYIEIPKLNCSLPIYRGTSDDVLQIAIGHLAGSSLPTGGKSTHCVVSGHRGLPSAKLFTNLDKLIEGDIFTVRTLDEVLCYEVVQISIVLPTETELLQIVPGEDLCTLMTCTPYGVNTHRLLVRGRRADNPQSADIRVTADALQIDPIITASVLSAAVIPFIIAAAVIMLVRKKHRKGAAE